VTNATEWRLRLAILLLCVTACPATAGRGAQATAPAGKTAPASSHPADDGAAAPTRRPEAIAEAQRLIAALSSMPELSRTKVEKLLGVSLRPAADAQGDPTLWEAPLATGPFARVRLREAGPKQKIGASLSLEARAGSHLPKRLFDPALIGPIVDINPRIPPEGTVAHKPQSADHGPVLEFWAKSEQLRQVTFRRDPKPIIP
jgi:hypothetical protein